MFLRLVVFSATLLVFSGLALGATKDARLESFQLLDQRGDSAEIAPSEKSTLVYFYRGDW